CELSRCRAREASSRRERSGPARSSRHIVLAVGSRLHSCLPMQLEFHQLDLRWEHLRVREPHRQRRLLASLAESGQQTPIVVVLSQDNCERYLVIDGHKRIAGPKKRAGDGWKEAGGPRGGPEALWLDGPLRFSSKKSAREKGGFWGER